MNGKKTIALNYAKFLFIVMIFVKSLPLERIYWKGYGLEIYVYK